MSLIFQIQRVSQGGLCFVLNHLVGHYLYAKQNNLIFTLADDEWLFKHTLGFKDYFDSIETHTSDKLYKEPIIVMRTGDDRLSTTRFTVKEYQEAFSYVIRLNKYMEEKRGTSECGRSTVKHGINWKRKDGRRIEEVGEERKKG